MNRPTPRHGERACYLRGCRRTECADAHYRYMARYRYERAHGKQRRTDATPAADHVQKLIAAGWSRQQIADAAGISHCAARSLACRRYTTTRIDMAQRVLALPLTEPPATGRFTSGLGTVRRLRALAAIGHTYRDIAQETGIFHSNLGRMARWNPPQVEANTARAVAAAYRHMSRTPGTSVRARNTAARNGWHGPLAWDDIDNPAEQPDTDSAPTETPKFTRADAQHIAGEIRHLAGFGVPVHEIAARVGRSETYIRDQIRGVRGPGWRQQIGEAA